MIIPKYPSNLKRSKKYNNSFLLSNTPVQIPNTLEHHNDHMHMSNSPKSPYPPMIIVVIYSDAQDKYILHITILSFSATLQSSSPSTHCSSLSGAGPRMTTRLLLVTSMIISVMMLVMVMVMVMVMIMLTTTTAMS